MFNNLPRKKCISMVLVGTSGWNYGHWRQGFYPRGLPQSRWLEYYSGFFPTVEINSTFYRLPRSEYVERWRDTVPAGFAFAVKGSRFITHVKRLAEPKEPLERFLDVVSGLGGKLGPILWQLPPQMKRDDERLAVFADAIAGRGSHAFEFRHPSWFCDHTYQILEEAGAALCIPDHPAMPKAMVLTTGWTYIRLHYSGRYGLYSRPSIGKWARIIADFAGSGKDVYIYFNNDMRGFAIRNARQLMDALPSSPMFPAPGKG